MSDTTVTRDANQVGFRLAKETSLGVVDANTVWEPQEPNSFGDFGAQYNTVARAPITKTRQRKKGKVVDKDAAMNYASDVLAMGLRLPLEGYLFSNWGKQEEVEPTAVTGTQYTVANADMFTGMLILAQGFATEANNGLKLITARTAANVSVAGLTAEANPPAGASIKIVGFQAGAVAGVKFVSDGAGMRLTSTGTASFDLTKLNLRKGAWVHIGGDLATSQFASAGINGWARVKDVATSDALTLDLVSGVPASDSATGKTVRVFVADFLRNEDDPDAIICSSYQGERDFGDIGYEYVKGGVPNTFEMSMSLTEIITCQLGFVALDAEDKLPSERKAGSFPDSAQDVAFNTTTDLVRIRLSDDQGGELNGVSYATEMSMSINNNVTVRKALGHLGGVSVTAGDFVVSGSGTFYFSTNDAVNAVKNNADVGIDWGLVAENKGLYFDMPLNALGDARKSVEKDQAITLPLSYDAAESEGGYTMSVSYFAYLPNYATD